MTDRPNPRRIRQAMRDAIKAAAESIGCDGQGTNGLAGYMRALGMTEPATFGSMLRIVLQAESTHHPDLIETSGDPAATAQEALRNYEHLLRNPRLLLRTQDLPLPSEETPAEAVVPREPLKPRPRRKLHLGEDGTPGRAIPSSAHPTPQPHHRIIDAVDHSSVSPHQAAAAHFPPGTAATPLRLESNTASSQQPEPPVPQPSQQPDPAEQPPEQRCMAELDAARAERRALRQYRGYAADVVGPMPTATPLPMHGSHSVSMSDRLAKSPSSSPPLTFRVARDAVDPWASFRRGGGRC